MKNSKRHSFGPHKKYIELIDCGLDWLSSTNLIVITFWLVVYHWKEVRYTV